METIEIRGRRYKAIDAPEPGRCGNCAFKNGFGCVLAEETGDALSKCSAKKRPDGIDKYFVPAYLK